MKKIYILAIIMLLAFPCLSSAQGEKEALIQSKSIQLGFGLEYFSNTISWDEDKYSSKIKSLFLTLNTEFEFQEGLHVNASFGYSFSNYKGVQFRELPFSLEIGKNTIEGYLLGGEIRKSLAYSEELEIDGLGQLFLYLGSKEVWRIQELAVPGSAQGKPSWVRVTIGPIFTYKGFESLTPYLYLCFHKLWGTFTMDETVQELAGYEEQKFSSKSSFCTSLGGIYKITEVLSINAEASFMPYRGGVDLGLLIKALLSF